MEMNILLTGLAIFVFVIGAIIHFKNMPLYDIIDEVKEPLLMLFLYAEKQGWSNEEKMEWCLTQIVQKIHLDIDQATLEQIAQKLYDKYRNFIKSVLE